MNSAVCVKCHSDLHIIGYEDPYVYDGILIWVCAACENAWPRFSDGHRYDRALSMIRFHNVVRGYC